MVFLIIYYKEEYKKMISNYEYQYMQTLMNTYKNGVEEFNERTGEKTKHTPGVIFKVDLSKEFPIITVRKTFFKSCIIRLDSVPV